MDIWILPKLLFLKPLAWIYAQEMSHWVHGLPASIKLFMHASVCTTMALGGDPSDHCYGQTHTDLCVPLHGHQVAVLINPGDLLWKYIPCILVTQIFVQHSQWEFWFELIWIWIWFEFDLNFDLNWILNFNCIWIRLNFTAQNVLIYSSPIYYEEILSFPFPFSHYKMTSDYCTQNSF